MSEVIVPVVICTVVMPSQLVQTNRRYYNTIVVNSADIKYVKSPDRDSYYRTSQIHRQPDSCNITWPDHPIDTNGRIQGAIVLIESLDNKFLLVRNGNLWGLPKGARNYISYLDCKYKTDDHYRSTREILVHDSAVYSDAETPEDNACREVLEETGIIIDRELLRSIYEEQTNCYCSYDAFYYSYPKTASAHYDDLVTNGTDHENDELMWVTGEQLEVMLDGHVRSRVFNHVTYGLLRAIIEK